jgi:hypothetical protein
VFQIDKFLQNGGCFFCGVDEPWYLKESGQINITVVDLSGSLQGVDVYMRVKAEERGCEKNTHSVATTAMKT